MAEIRNSKFRYWKYSLKAVIILLIFLMALLVSIENTDAKMNKGGPPFAREELIRLPRWCQTQLLAMPRLFLHDRDAVPDSLMRERAKWAKIIGEDIMIYTHHYAYGLNWINRYKGSLYESYEGVKNDRKIALKTALNQFRFMVGHVKPKHSIYSSLHMNMAYLYLEQGNILKAAKSYKKIIKYKPGYARSYIEYARLLNSLGKKSYALKILNLGLKRTGGANVIKHQIAIMSGKKK